MLNRIPDFPNRERHSHNTDDRHRPADIQPVSSDEPESIDPSDPEDALANQKHKASERGKEEKEATTTDPQAALKALQEQARQMGGFVYIPEDNWTVSLQGTATRTPSVPPLQPKINHSIPEEDSIDEPDETQAEQTREDGNDPSSSHKDARSLRKFYGRLRWRKGS